MLEGEDCDRDADLGALLVVVRRLRSTQRPEPVLSRGGRSTCMSTCRDLRERSAREAELVCCQVVHQRAFQLQQCP